MNYTRTLCIVDHMNEIANRLLMSDSLKGMIPLLEEEKISSYEDSFVMIGLVFDTEGDEKLLAGSLVGISREPEVVKVDVRTPVQNAFSFFKRWNTVGVNCLSYHVSHLDEVLDVSGPFRIVSPRLMDFDIESKMCTLGIDLIKT